MVDIRPAVAKGRAGVEDFGMVEMLCYFTVGLVT
jgi:hypothetical protein